MKCPVCAEPTKVVDSRKKIDHLYRRRECKACGTRFSTREIPYHFKFVPKDNTEEAKEIARLEELNKLIEEQLADASASSRGHMRTGGNRNSKKADWSMDRKNLYGKDAYEYEGD